MAKQYITNLPKEIPDSYFDNLDGEVFPNVKALINNEYSEIEKIAVTEAVSNIKALSNIFFRNSNKTNARSLLKMFKPNHKMYVFEVPEKADKDAYGKPISTECANTFQEMELAMEMAEGRGCKPESCYHEASKLLRVYRTL